MFCFHTPQNTSGFKEPLSHQINQTMKAPLQKAQVKNLEENLVMTTWLFSIL